MLFLWRCQVTLIPTHDTEVTRDWYQQTHERQQDLNIMVLASSSTVVMQDESFPACKIEFWAGRATCCPSPTIPPPWPEANVVALRFIKACCSLMVWKLFAALDAFDSVAETKVWTLLYVCDTSTLSTDPNVCFLPLGNNINLNNVNQSSATYLTVN